jgi:hypothetical protein
MPIFSGSSFFTDSSFGDSFSEVVFYFVSAFGVSTFGDSAFGTEVLVLSVVVVTLGSLFSEPVLMLIVMSVMFVDFIVKKIFGIAHL